MSLHVTIKRGDLDALQLSVHQRLTDPRPVYKAFHVYMIGRTGQTFRALRHGGSYRGVAWKPFAPQYTRKTDGVTVPAWGGVAKARGRGLVKGRRRPSGKRVSSSSSLLRDTGRLAAAAGTTARLTRGGMRFEMVTENVAYAVAQQERRPFLFFQHPRDNQELTRMALAHLAGNKGFSLAAGGSGA